MPLLTDVPAPRDLRLLQDVATGYGEIGEWPIWQYVLLRQNLADADGEATLRGMPQWQFSYRSIWTGSQPPPEPATRVHLTVHGMVHCGNQNVDGHVAAFVAAIQLANEWYEDITPLPDQLQLLTVEGNKLTTAVNLRAGTALSAVQLREVLRHEPPTSSGIRDEGDSFVWDLTYVRLRAYRGITNVMDYLAQLEEQVGTNKFSIVRDPLPSLALPQALDRLDLVWRLVFDTRLLHINRALLPVSITLPVSGFEEFESRCSALAELLHCMAACTEGESKRGAFDRMSGRLSACLNGDATRALSAVEVLRAVRDVRNGQQHSATQPQYEQARRDLGLPGFNDDWSGAWEQVRRRVYDALMLIADELSAHLDASTGTNERSG